MASLFPPEAPQMILLLLLSLLLPLSIFLGRGNVRKRRLAILDDLEKALKAAPRDEQRAIGPSFEIVRSRYAHGDYGAELDEPLSVRRRLAGWAGSIAAYLLPTTIFVLLSATGFYLLFAAIRMDGFEAPNLLLSGLSAQPEAYQAGTAAMISAAFLGSYIWAIGYLILRVANFDLSPLSFLRVSTHILLTTFIAGVFRHVVAAPLPEQQIAAGTLLGIAFVMGLFPNLGINALADRLPRQLRIKRMPKEAGDIGRDLPLDLLDGIDSAIKFRLASLEITDVQNLAAVNPIFLYVESPYGLFGILDWMAQAQLLLAVGPEKFLALRRVGVRDVHALIEIGRTEEGRRLVGPILTGTEDVPDPVVVASLSSIAATLHVRRLQNFHRVLSAAIQRSGDPSPADWTAPAASPVAVAAE